MVLRHTASTTDSTIWNPIKEADFMRAVQDAVQASNQMAGAFKVYKSNQSEASTSNGIPYQLEYQLAQDIAFIAACKEDASAVSATSISSNSVDDSIRFHVASNGGIDAATREQFKKLAGLIESCARMELDREESFERFLELIIAMDQAKIISRLKCGLWTPPRTYESRPAPLLVSMQETLNRIKSRTATKHAALDQMSNEVSDMRDLVSKMDSGRASDICKNLASILRGAGRMTGVTASLEDLLHSLSVKLPEADAKVIRAFDKFANYWHLCQRLARICTSTLHRNRFKSTQFQFLEHFERHRVNNKIRFVHAEVQLVTFHRLQRIKPRPKVIGTSKATCYLCDLFLSQHAQYKYAATHGMLYELWTIPDVLEYTTKDRKMVRNVISFMYRKLTEIVKTRFRPGMMFPVQSGIFEPPYYPSPTATARSRSLSSKRLESIGAAVNEQEAGIWPALPTEQPMKQQPTESIEQKPTKELESGYSNQADDMIPVDGNLSQDGRSDSNQRQLEQAMAELNVDEDGDKLANSNRVHTKNSIASKTTIAAAAESSTVRRPSVTSRDIPKLPKQRVTGPHSTQSFAVPPASKTAAAAKRKRKHHGTRYDNLAKRERRSRGKRQMHGPRIKQGSKKVRDQKRYAKMRAKNNQGMTTQKVHKFLRKLRSFLASCFGVVERPQADLVNGHRAR